MIRTILALTDETPRFESALALAVDLGRRFAAHVDCLHIRPDPTALPPLPVDIPPYVRNEIATAIEKADEERRHATRQIYDRVAESANVSMDWLVAIGPEPDLAGGAGRLRDLIVIGRPDDPDEGSWRDTLDAILFDSGRPLLLVLAPR